MSTEPIFLTPVLQDKIWGGKKLQTEFGFDLPSDTVGEAWVISTHPHGESTVSSPEQYEGMGLNELYHQHPELFGVDEPGTFPLLTKILDAKDDLSVQVHPDDVYGQEHEGELGKTECWFVISADEDATIIYGHNARTEEEFRRLVETGEWDELLREVPVKAGDFFYVPHGTIHAIKGGITILETQQNSDTTYRVYDYNRTDKDGNTRELHLEDSIAVSNIPHIDPAIQQQEDRVGMSAITHYLTNEYFSVYRWQIRDQLIVDLTGDYTLVTVLDGQGMIEIDRESYPIEKAQSFIIPHGVSSVTLSGDLDMIASNPE
ncbi:mannose-6-phosphate isomerase, class I [Dolosigranulum pigrum]|uniref:mannose-6-phosphate isomerase, class I n=1 Tax=Dolosigranulum pigrum TaxID=29394 RepID=UPI000DBF63CC|nr:mannose-6-phosphate isomerase, class I [Dolosigranulum pigrum]RAN56950.1 mannose-6-phosphate isomerase, class I [Dolosigranulum pigrum]RAN57578.1 mannose-6-phosphate isomerase, class I [Dolosigranulum pigrum]VTU64205.1 Mannose-6-phosphate isomerase [Lactobacillus salivarius UCC118] [Dolosigranulum pigrum]